MPNIHPLYRLVSGTLLAAIIAFSPFYSLAARSFVAPSFTAVTSSSAAIIAPSPTSIKQPLSQTPLVIGEVAWAGSSLSTTDEWLELWNLSNAPMPIGGWSLRGASVAAPIVFPPTATIPSHSSFLISNRASSDTKSALGTNSQLVTTNILLSNTQLKIELVDAMGAVVDRAGTGSMPLAGASLPIKISMLRVDPLADGSRTSAWTNASSSQNFKSGINDLGTPGTCDRCGSSMHNLLSASVSSTNIIATSSVMHMQHDTHRTATTTASIQATPLSTTNTAPLVHATSAVSAVTMITFNTTTNPLHETAFSTRRTTGRTTSTGAGTTATPSVRSTSVATTSATEIRLTSTNTGPVPLQTTHAQTQGASKFDETPKPNYNMLRLNEVSPSPLSGQEWIEIATLDASHEINLQGCSVHDRNGRIRTIGDLTLNPKVSRYVVITLPKSRLNNTGDSVALYAPDGRLLDVVSYGATQKGESWVRFPDMTGEWEKTSSSTPNAPNERSVLTASRQTETAQEETPHVSLNERVALITTTAKTEEANVHAAQSNAQTIIFEKQTSSPQALSPSFHDKQKETVSAETQKLPTKPTNDVQMKKTPSDAPRITTRKKLISRTPRVATPIRSISFNMLHKETSDNLRVRLTGRVGSLPGLIARHAFILQNPDGRGLLVTIPSRQRLPRFGTDVSAIGSLQIDEKGTASLRMSTKDAWSQLPTSTAHVRSRLVDLLIPSAEDAWSLITVTGTVMRVTSDAVQLDLGDAELAVVIKPLVRYRAKRLVVGDVLTVRGLLDLTRDDPRLLPRLAEDISIVTHAPPKQTVAAAELRSQGPALPSWVPFGAAGGAIAVTEGVKRLHRRKKMRALAQKAANASS